MGRRDRNKPKKKKKKKKKKHTKKKDNKESSNDSSSIFGDLLDFDNISDDFDKFRRRVTVEIRDSDARRRAATADPQHPRPFEQMQDNSSSQGEGGAADATSNKVVRREDDLKNNRATHTKEGGLVSGHPLGGSNGERSMSVSYTDLPLPTIDQV